MTDISDTVERIVDFNLAKYREVELRHMQQLYNDRPHKYAHLTRTEFVEQVYIAQGMAENFRKYWFGESHLKREAK